eukprot:scaffold141631_cov20-Prasinocladus_malaysianus.AAC.1
MSVSFNLWLVWHLCRGVNAEAGYNPRDHGTYFRTNTAQRNSSRPHPYLTNILCVVAGDFRAQAITDA